MANVREAILRAADHIEQHPESFVYQKCTVPPKECGSYGCAMGWIAFFSGVREDYATGLDSKAMKSIGVPYWAEFEPRMYRLNYSWRHSAYECARTLRMYADKYHPAPSLRNWAKELMDKIVANAVESEAA